MINIIEGAKWIPVRYDPQRGGILIVEDGAGEPLYGGRVAIEDNILLMGADRAEREHYAQAIVGVSRTLLGPVAVYSADAVVAIMQRDFSVACAGGRPCKDGEHDHLTEAVEFFDFNVAGAWVGEQTPIYLHDECDQHVTSTDSCPCPVESLDRWGESRALLALERAGGRRAGSARATARVEPSTGGYIDPAHFPIDRLDFSRAAASVLSAGSRPSRFWGAVAIPSKGEGPSLLLYVYGQSNWSVVRPLLGYWGSSLPRTSAELARHATRRALHPAPGYRAYGTPIFLDPTEAIGRRALRRLVEAAQRDEGSVTLDELLGQRRADKSA